MADASNNSWGSHGGSSLGPSDAGPGVPPPPAEVKVRTLASDLESMARSGGGAAQFQSIKALAIPAEQSEPAAKHEETGAQKTSSIWMIIVVLASLAIAAGIGYLVYRLFFAGAPAEKPVPQNSTPPAAPPPPQPLPTPPPPTPTTTFIHASLFKKPADQAFTMVIRSTAQDASDLQTFSQRLTGLIPAASAGGFFEINFKDGDGYDLQLQKVIDAADIGVLDPQFLTWHFIPDGAFFVYKDKAGSWPGLVLSLKLGENWLFLKNDVAKLETSPRIQNLFLNSPGSPASSFKDTIESGQPARILNFTTPTASSSFVYGWFHGDLILSASEAGFQQAISRL